MKYPFSGAEDILKEIDTTVNTISNHKKLLIQNIQEIQDTMKRSNLIITGREESEHYQIKGPENFSTKS